MIVVNGIKRKSVPQEVVEFEFNGWCKDEEEMQNVVNFYNQYEGSDAYKTNGRFVKGY